MRRTPSSSFFFSSLLVVFNKRAKPLYSTESWTEWKCCTMTIVCQSSGILKTDGKNLSGSTITFIIIMWFKVESNIYRNNKGFNCVCRTYGVVLIREWSRHAAISEETDSFEVFMADYHELLMEPWYRCISIIHMVVSKIFDTYILLSQYWRIISQSALIFFHYFSDIGMELFCCHICSH